MEHVKLLDCTLRDGGHITNSYFGAEVIEAIISNLQQSGVDIIEFGFLQDCDYDINRAMYNNIAEASKILPPRKEGVSYALMAQEDLYDFDKLEENDGTVDFIRVSFHDFDIKEGLLACEKVIEKGYKCFINPINIMGYTDASLIELLKEINRIKPYCFTLVDTFGSMKKQDLMRLYYLIDHNLMPGIRIAIHLHENQSLSYSLAQNFIDINSPVRDICIDGSLYGMGRVPGNLCIELIMKYMNDTLGTGYDLDPVYDAIDEFIVDLKKKNPWGYSTAYALSAQHKVHRTYAEYLMSQGRLKHKQINRILSQISDEHKTRYDREYIEKLYADYQSYEVSDEAVREKLLKVFEDRKILIIAPGSSINDKKDEILEYVKREKPLVICANFIWKELKCDYAFFSNLRRFESFKKRSGDTVKIITSNIVRDAEDTDSSLVVNYSEIAYFNDKISDNCMLMLLRLLNICKVTNVSFAGFDGFGDKDNFAIRGMEGDSDLNSANMAIKEALCPLKNVIEMEFLTPSAFSQSNGRLDF